PARADRVQPGRQEADREDADDALEEPADLPDPVALVDVELPLGEAEERAQVGAPDIDRHVDTSAGSSSASSVLPVRCMKTPSSVAPPCARQSAAGLPTASTRPTSIISTRLPSSAASPISCVTSTTVL